MKNQQRTKKHHFVPECYLKNFIREKCLFTLDVRKVQKGYNTQCKESQPGMICYLEDYYKIESGSLNNQFQLNGYDDLFIETDVLTNLEGKYGDLWNKITAKQELKLAEAVNMADFIIQMKLRNPYWFEHTVKKYKDEWIDSAIDSIYKEKFITDPRFAHIPEGIQKLVYDYVREDNKSDASFSKKMQLFGLIQRYSKDPERNIKFREAIINCQWTVLTAPPQGPYFITSDNPGFSTSNDELTYNTKFSEGFYFHFPLSPFHCLIIADYEFDNCYSESHLVKYMPTVNIGADEVIQVNNRAMQCVNKLLVASDDWYLSKIAVINNPKKCSDKIDLPINS